MTASSSSEPSSLHIRAADEGTEIFVMNSGLKRVATGLGSMQFEVEPGIYKVRFRSGASQQDELVDASTPGETVYVEGSPIHFHSAVPIEHTRTTRESHQRPASHESCRTHRSLGSGGRLFLFVREIDTDQPFDLPRVTLHALDKTQLASLGEGVGDAGAQWAALSLDLDPGTYAVRVDSQYIGQYEIFVTVSPGWQTQVFFIMEDIWRGNDAFRAPSIRTASILIAPNHRGFEPDDGKIRVCELARHALAQGRDVVSKTVMQKLLSGKFEAPMLGILAANLLLRRRRPDWELLGTICRNLYHVLGRHPDLDALSLAVRGWKGESIESFVLPPSLRRSWDHVVHASRRRATLVPSGSPLAEVAEELVLAGPWLTHRMGGRVRERVLERASVAGAERAMERLVSADREVLEVMARESRSDENSLSGLQQSVLSAALSFAEANEYRTSKNDESQLRPEARRLLKGLSAPTYAIADAVMNLARRIDV